MGGSLPPDDEVMTMRLLCPKKAFSRSSQLDFAEVAECRDVIGQKEAAAAPECETELEPAQSEPSSGTRAASLLELALSKTIVQQPWLCLGHCAARMPSQRKF